MLGESPPALISDAQSIVLKTSYPLYLLYQMVFLEALCKAQGPIEWMVNYLSESDQDLGYCE